MAKKTLVCLHGALGTIEDFTHVANKLAEDFDLKLINFSGHGKGTFWPKDFRIETFAQELEDFFKQQKLKDVAVLGYSMGGYVALYHKSHFEDSPIASIVTYGTKFNWTEEAVLSEIPKLDPVFIQTKAPHFAEELEHRHGERWKQVLRSTAHMMQNLQKLDGLSHEDLADVSCPVILLRGSEDRMVTYEESEKAANHLLNGRYVEIPAGKHEFASTNSDQIIQEIKNLIYPQ
jgi:pimeloyl-ACP methyl ester carboxylesterase